jgi:nitrite reductase (NADH) small subunit
MAEWIRIASAAECPPGKVIERLAGERIVALANVDGRWHAIDGVCPHQGGPLGQGRLSGGVVMCPWHGWRFDTTTGQHCDSPLVCQESFEVESREDGIYVRAASEAESS